MNSNDDRAPDDLRLDGPHAELGWKEVERRHHDAAAGLTHKSEDHVSFPSSWLAAVRPLFRNKDTAGFAFALAIYALVRMDRAVPIPNSLTANLGLDDQTAHAALKKLAEARLITLDRTSDGVLQATLLWMPPGLSGEENEQG